MVRYILIDVVISLVFRNIWAIGKRDISYILVEDMFIRVAVMISFIGPYRIFVPFTGKQALTTCSLESSSDTADAGKEIYEGEIMLIGTWG